MSPLAYIHSLSSLHALIASASLVPYHMCTPLSLKTAFLCNERCYFISHSFSWLPTFPATNTRRAHIGLERRLRYGTGGNHPPVVRLSMSNAPSMASAYVSRWARPSRPPSCLRPTPLTAIGISDVRPRSDSVAGRGGSLLNFVGCGVVACR